MEIAFTFMRTDLSLLLVAEVLSTAVCPDGKGVGVRRSGEESKWLVGHKESLLIPSLGQEGNL